MKFRAEMTDPQCMREFMNMITTLTKLARSCVMNITKERIYFIANEDSSSAAPLVWMDIETNLYFNAYNMEAANPEYPQIVLSFSTLNLGRAFAQMRTATPHYCKFKLTNIQFPCLNVETGLTSSNPEDSRQFKHDVPINIIPRSDWCYYELPQIPKCEIILNMPLNRKMRSIIERIKNISPVIIFYATSKGELCLVSETELATITTRCTQLEVVEVNKQRTTPGKDVIESHCSVDCKKASILISALQVPTAEMAIGIDEERLMHWKVSVRQGVTIHSIIPAVAIN